MRNSDKYANQNNKLSARNKDKKSTEKVYLDLYNDKSLRKGILLEFSYFSNLDYIACKNRSRAVKNSSLFSKTSSSARDLNSFSKRSHNEEILRSILSETKHKKI